MSQLLHSVYRSRFLAALGRLALGLGVASFLALGACSVEQTEEGEMPDVDVSGDPGNLPEYEVEKTEEGEMPDVDVDVEGGQMPEYDVETPDVDVDVEEEEIEIPDQIEVPVPDVDVEEPGEEEYE